MKNLQNLHTHSTFCDGIYTPEEMIKAAIEKGFDSLGFSGHSAAYYSPYKKVTEETTEEYKKEIKALKEKYASILPVFLGLEVEMYSGVDMSGYDYLIGSAHYLKAGDGFIGFDRSATEVRSVIDKYFGGDGMTFAKAYYSALAELPKYGNFDIIGHFDLITKNSEKTFLFDESSEEYLKAATEAMDALEGKIPFFEVNTGAISRGYKSIPYPTIPLLKEFKKRNFGVVITSDCHDSRYLDCFFEETRLMLSECGYKERYILTKSGFNAVEL